METEQDMSPKYYYAMGVRDQLAFLLACVRKDGIARALGMCADRLESMDPENPHVEPMRTLLGKGKWIEVLG